MFEGFLGLQVSYVNEPLSNCQDLDCMKKAALFLEGVDNQQIVISYKDLSLQTSINIHGNESLHFSKAFRNTSPCESGLETVRSFQPGLFPEKYVLHGRNLFTILNTV